MKIFRRISSLIMTTVGMFLFFKGLTGNNILLAISGTIVLVQNFTIDILVMSIELEKNKLEIYKEINNIDN